MPDTTHKRKRSSDETDQSSTAAQKMAEEAAIAQLQPQDPRPTPGWFVISVMIGDSLSDYEAALKEVDNHPDCKVLSYGTPYTGLFDYECKYRSGVLDPKKDSRWESLRIFPGKSGASVKSKASKKMKQK